MNILLPLFRVLTLLVAGYMFIWGISVAGISYLLRGGPRFFISIPEGILFMIFALMTFFMIKNKFRNYIFFIVYLVLYAILLYTAFCMILHITHDRNISFQKFCDLTLFIIGLLCPLVTIILQKYANRAAHTGIGPS